MSRYTLYKRDSEHISLLVFFFKQKTAYEMRISDWSSDVCSSDLKAIRSLYPDYPIWRGKDFKYEYTDDVLAIDVINGGPGLREWVDDAGAAAGDQLGRASCRERVCQSV